MQFRIATPKMEANLNSVNANLFCLRKVNDPISDRDPICDNCIRFT